MAKYLVLNSDREVVTQLIKGVHDIPSDAVLIDDQSWYTVTQDIGCIWHLSEAGELTKLPKRITTNEQLVREFAREWRNQVLASTEWLMTRQRDEQDMGRPTTLTAEQFTQLLGYRQELRDWPQSSDFPTAEHRPLAPEWIAGQVQ